MIRILIRHEALSTAMHAAVGQSEVVHSPGDTVVGDLVITTTQDTSPEACAVLSDGGVRVLVLALQPRNPERVRYLGAGAAAYIEMTADAAALAQAVATATAPKLAGR